MASRKPPVQALAASRPVEKLIHVVRGEKVMLDSDLAALYEVPTRVLNQALKRNRERFPEDFAFQLSEQEAESLRSQIVTSNTGRGGRRYAPYVFTEHGIAMLSTVLRSERAVQMSIEIIRAFVRMRQLLLQYKDIAERVEKLERSHIRTGSVIEVLVEDIGRVAQEIEQMKALPPGPKRKIGFRLGEKD